MQFIVKVETELAMDTNRWMNVAKAVNSIGVVLQLQGKYEESIEKCHMALELARKSSENESATLSLIVRNTIGTTYLKQEKVREALKHFKTALQGNEDCILPDDDIAMI